MNYNKIIKNFVLENGDFYIIENKEIIKPIFILPNFILLMFNNLKKSFIIDFYTEDVLYEKITLNESLIHSFKPYSYSEALTIIEEKKLNNVNLGASINYNYTGYDKNIDFNKYMLKLYFLSKLNKLK